jgi:hypothetical protein
MGWFWNESLDLYNKRRSGLPEKPNRGRMTLKHAPVCEIPAKQIE